MRRRPLWYYGILCLIGAVLPTMLLPPPVDAAQAASRFTLQIVVSAVGLALIGLHFFLSRRRTRIK
jgi:hypothetical protein